MDRTVAFIPVRGGSKSIPLKNIKELCGKPLVYWTAKAACEAVAVDKVYVATDSDVIKRAITSFCNLEKELFSKLEVIGRSEDNANDIASTESVMLEFARNYEFENIILVQATSPLLEGKDIDGGMEVFERPGIDSVISLVRQKRFIWKDCGNHVVSTNYDVFKRPRRQEFDGYLMENGAFYITSKESLLKSRNRVSGIIGSYVMSEDTAIEIDEPDDFFIIEKLLRKRVREKKLDNIKEIKMVVTDCDGCLTDGGMYYSEKGDELKKFNTKDGMALSRLREKGIITGIITGENRELNRRRAEKLHMDFIEQGVKDKLAALQKICAEFDISLSEVLYIGDDINDLEAMNAAGFSACPADAADEVRKAADYVSVKRGGDGAVREIISETFDIHR